MEARDSPLLTIELPGVRCGQARCVIWTTGCGRTRPDAVLGRWIECAARQNTLRVSPHIYNLSEAGIWPFLRKHRPQRP